jgi:hypothetical protein
MSVFDEMTNESLAKASEETSKILNDTLLTRLNELVEDTRYDIQGVARSAMAQAAERIETLESKLALREHQLRLAIAGMAQGKDCSVFVIENQAGEVVDVITRDRRTGSDPELKIPKLAS